MIPIAKPLVGEEEQAAVLEVLKSGALTQGARVQEFEERFAAYQGAKFGIATSNGTTALCAALMAHGIGPGDEVIVPAFTFFATASSVLSVGATPRFADIDPVSYCITADTIREALTPKTRAVMPVHLYGHPADMPGIAQLCEGRGITLIEDAAQAHGAAIGPQRVGTWGTASFSFYPTKNMTTTEGGIVLTNDPKIDQRMRMIRNQGMSTQYLHEVVGYNLRMTDLCAAIGLVQLKKLPGWTEQRRSNAAFYAEHLKNVVCPRPPADTTHVYHQFTIRIPGGRTAAGRNRDEVLKKLADGGVGARVYYPRPIHRQPVFLEREPNPTPLPETEKATLEVLSLPVHPALSRADLEHVAARVNEC